MILRSGTIFFVAIAGFLVYLVISCTTGKKRTSFDNFQYERFKDSVFNGTAGTAADSDNIFDAPEFTPGIDSLDSLLIRMDNQLRWEAALMEQLDTLKTGMRKEPGFTPEEKDIINENIKALDSFYATRNEPDQGKCTGKDCILYIAIDKSKQTLFLYILGQLKDTFKVSTGKGNYQTPNMDRRPAGPVFTRYNSRRFPGGNYMGMGNMPYAVFLRGGYAIHGTTPGNYSRLGTPASHGCIRLHPDNAKLLNALVKTVGLSETWVTINDTIIP
ncbi:MAG TPA: L,D-transpeptidase [Chitinophagaceae bacterium]|nr:L,D-transpeptidase [Chitinophagaceae bacterium]